MGIFDALDEADVFENSKYFQPGRYIVKIKQCKFINSGFKGDSFVIEATILASLGTEHPEAPKPGELAAQVWNASGEKRDIARNTWLGFLCAIYNAKQADYTGPKWKIISEQVIENNALGDTVALVEVFMKKTRAGGDFTQHAWRGVPTAEQLVEFGLQAA